MYVFMNMYNYMGKYINTHALFDILKTNMSCTSVCPYTCKLITKCNISSATAYPHKYRKLEFNLTPVYKHAHTRTQVLVEIRHLHTYKRIIKKYVCR